MNSIKDEVAKFTNRDAIEGGLKEVLQDADVFIGVSVAGALTEEMVSSMKQDPIIFAMGIRSEIMRILRKQAVPKSSDRPFRFPNQVNNVLASLESSEGHLTSCDPYQRENEAGGRRGHR